MIGLSTRDSIEIIEDQYGRPTSAVHLSKFLSKLVSASYQLEFGVYNFSSSGSIVSWSGFAEEIFAHAFKFDLIDSIPAIKNISSKEYDGAALRPSYSVLSNAKISSNQVKYNVIKKENGGFQVTIPKENLWNQNYKINQ